MPLREKCPYSEFFLSECRKMRTRKIANTDTFHAVCPIEISLSEHFIKCNNRTFEVAFSFSLVKGIPSCPEDFCFILLLRIQIFLTLSCIGLTKIPYAHDPEKQDVWVQKCLIGSEQSQ